jgi:hypothetical protein
MVFQVVYPSGREKVKTRCLEGVKINGNNYHFFQLLITSYYSPPLNME